MTDREYGYVIKLHDYAIKLIDLKQENTKLKKQLAKLENPKPKRIHKYKAITKEQHCKDPYIFCENCEYFRGRFCDYHKYHNPFAPYKTKDNKYILRELIIEVK